MKLLIVFLIVVSVAGGATIRSDQSGAVVQYCTDSLSSGLCVPPESVAGEVKFDEETNPTLLTSIRDKTPQYTITGGVLMQNGVPVTINANGPLKASREQAEQIWNSIKTQAAFDALTAAQKAEALRRANKMIILLLVKEGILSPEDFQ